MSSLREAASRLCTNFPGGYDAMAVAIGVSSGGMLRQKVLGHKGARLDVDELLAIQSAADSSLLAEAFAHESGGVFIPVPRCGDIENEDVAKKMADIATRFGTLATHFQMSLANDGVIDSGERKMLEADALELFARAQEFVGLAVSVYGTKEAQAEQAL